MAAIVFPQMDGQQEAEAFIREETAAAKPDDECTAGDAFYVVSNKWFTQWCQYSGFLYDPTNPKRKPRVVLQDQPLPRPGPIDNSDLLAQPPVQSDLTPEQAASVVALRDGLVDKKDFWAVREVTWNLLKDWYGVAGPEIRRECHPVGRRVQLDMHQQHFRVVVREPAGAGPDGATGQPVERDCVVGASVHCQLSNLKTMACQQLGVDPEDYDMHDYRGLTQGAQLEATAYKTLTGNKLADQQALLLLPRQAAGAASPGASVPILAPAPPSIITAATSPVARPLSFSPRYSSPSSPLSRSFDRAPSWAEDAVFPCEGRGHGLAGLGNLGNTCFMNSSLQCLAHSWPLMQTFLSGEYKRDLNRDNPLSLGGKLAAAFAALMDKLWRGGVGHVSPKLFKWQLAKFAPQFSGYAQQDSQELLAFLLDGLHEDLNRITDKPYVEDKDSDGRPDEEVAAEAWHNYRRRNDSVIVDAFQYLCRSKLTCPRCQYQSVKFDPLMYLTLPLPSSKKRVLTFTVAYIDGSAAPRQYGIELPKSATVGQLYAGIAELAGLATETPEQVLLLTQFNTSNGDSAVYDDLKARLTALEDFRPRGFFYRSSGPTSLYVAWVYPSPEDGPRSGRQLVQVVHKHRSSYVVPPTPLFIDQQHLAALSTERDLGDTLVQPGGGRDAIDAALAAALRPLRKHADVAPESAAPAAGEPAGSSRMSTDSPPPRLQQQQQTPQAGVAADGPAPMEEAGQTPAAAGSGAGDGEAMEVEQQQQQHEQQQQEQQEQRPQQVQQPGGAPAGDEAWHSGAGEAAAAGAAADPEAFDMWAPQKEDDARAAAAAAAAAASQPLYLLKAAKPNTFNGGVSTYDAKLEVPEEPGKPLLLLAEWQEAAAALYDPAPLLTSPERDPSAAALAERAKGGGKGVTLADCLETFLEEEQLDADESWYCSKCKDHVQADKKLDLWSLPDVLVILLQRFSHSRYSRDKLDTLVHFPLKGLDMSPYLLGRQAHAAGGGQNGSAPPAPVYNLYAVSNHYGSMGGGHYTAYCRMPGDPQERWYTFDDSHVSEMDASGVQTKAAYVLFYKRQGAEVDLQALLEQHRQQQQQEAADGGRSVGAAPPSPAGGPPPSPGGGVVAAPPAPPPLPGAAGGGGSTTLGKRQPEMASIGEEEVEGGDDEAAIAGQFEIDCS